MNWVLLFSVTVFAYCEAEISDFEDVFSVLTNGNKHSVKNNGHKLTKNGNGRPGIVHDSYEMAFPPFPPLINENIPLISPVRGFSDDKDIFSESGDQKESSTNIKQQKKPKDKVIMSFTEFFIPFMNHKSNFDFPTLPRKFDFFDNILKNFGFRDIEEPIFKISKQKKITLTKNSTKSDGSVVDTSISNNDSSKKSEKIKSYESLFHKPRDTEIMLFQNGIGKPEFQNEKDTIAGCCTNPECKNCRNGFFKESSLGTERKKKSPEEFDEDDDYYALRAAVKQETPRKKKEQTEETNLEKLMRMSLLYTVPILIGISGAILALEILRRDSKGKDAHKLAKEYGPIQHC